jgi:hypothetical protein
MASGAYLLRVWETTGRSLSLFFQFSVQPCTNNTNKILAPKNLQRLTQQLPHRHQSPYPLWKSVMLSSHITYAANVRHSIRNANFHSPIIHRSHPRHPVLDFIGDRPMSTRPVGTWTHKGIGARKVSDIRVNGSRGVCGHG